MQGVRGVFVSSGNLISIVNQKFTQNQSLDQDSLLSPDSLTGIRWRLNPANHTRDAINGVDEEDKENDDKSFGAGFNGCTGHGVENYVFGRWMRALLIVVGADQVKNCSAGDFRFLFEAL